MLYGSCGFIADFGICRIGWGDRNRGGVSLETFLPHITGYQIDAVKRVSFIFIKGDTTAHAEQ